MLQRPDRLLSAPYPQAAHCRICLKSMDPLNHRGWARLAARPDKCERRRRKNKAKTGLKRRPAASGDQIAAEVGETGRRVCSVRISGNRSESRFRLTFNWRNTLMRKWLLAAAAAAIFVAPGIASAQSPILIKFSHVVAPNTPKGKGAEKFKELAEKYTNGKVKVEVYPNSTLYKDKEELEALQLGAVQMLAPSNSKFGPMGIKDFEVFDLPYLLPNQAALRKVTEGPLGKAMLKKLEGKGMIGLAYWDNGFKEMSANKPLRMPEDYKGLKFRIQSSKVLEAQFRALGAVPQVMAFSEVYQALQTGVVDGQENTPSNIYTQKFHEVQKYTTLTNHGYIGYVVVVNKKFWDDLPKDIRGQLEKAMNEATEYSNKIAASENDEALEEIKKSGKTQIIVPTAAENAAMRKAMDPLYQDMASRVGKQLIDDVVKATHGVTN
jgi:C4-dicarboxylate-binding protein DctP